MIDLITRANKRKSTNYKRQKVHYKHKDYLDYTACGLFNNEFNYKKTGEADDVTCRRCVRTFLHGHDPRITRKGSRYTADRQAV